MGVEEALGTRMLPAPKLQLVLDLLRLGLAERGDAEAPAGTSARVSHHRVGDDLASPWL